MSGYWQCALICERKSDKPLAETLQSLMLARRPGDDIAVEVYRPERATDRSVAAKLAVIAADDVYDLSSLKTLSPSAYPTTSLKVYRRNSLQERKLRSDNGQTLRESEEET